MQKILLIFLGSGIGGVLRYAISLGFDTLNTTKFPWATFTANGLASLLIGLFFALSSQKNWLSPSMLLLLTAGLCGGLSTFSTFSHETIRLWQSHDYLVGIVYILGSVLACLGCTYVGSRLI